MKQKFISLLLSTQRNGIENLLEHLEHDTDFYYAPASTQYHGAYREGLIEHSLNVYEHLSALNRLYDNKITKNSVIIISLLHDICKSDFYENEMRSIKRRDEKGNLILQNNGKPIWDEIEIFTVNDSYPLGHGEKSVIILQKYIELTDEEIFCIRWHMMAYDDIVRGYAGNLSLTKALEKYPAISLTHSADLLSLNYYPKEN